MAKRLPKLNSIELDTIRVEYNQENDTVRIIAQDSDLVSPFAVSVQKGGKLEQELKSLLASKGITRKIIPAQKQVTMKSKHNLVIDPQGAIPTLGELDSKGKVLSVTSIRRGIGKSTAAVMLGGALARTSQFNELDNPYKICVVDFDVANGSVGKIVGSTKEGSLGIYESNNIVKETILNNTYYDSNLGVYVLPVSLAGNVSAISYLNADFYVTLLAELKKTFNLIIVDTANNDLAKTNEIAYNNSDTIVLVSNYDRSTYHSVNTWISEFKNKDLFPKITVLLNNTPKLQVEANMHEIKNLFTPLSIVGNIPMDSVSILTSLKNKNLGALFNGGNKVGEAYQVVASRLVE